MTLNSLAAVQRGQGRGEDARKSLEEALKIYRALAAQNPERYQPYVALTLEDLILLHGELNRPKDARKGLRGIGEDLPGAGRP